MKGGSLDRTKVVLRRLPPTITQAQLLEQIDGAFAGRYRWCSFRSGKNHPKHPSYSRAYIDFNGSDDVIEFAEFFDGHVFVNEKGGQYKASVEYAPSQRVPKKSLKKDGLVGTISKDAEYKEFLEYVTKPVENLPSAEIQLERREAERAGAAKESPIVTPLMDFIRQKRAASGCVHYSINGSLSNGKLSRELGGLFVGNSRHGSEKRRIPTTMGYMSRDSAKSTNGKRYDQEYSSEPVNSRTEALVGDSGMSTHIDSVNKKILLLKGKGKEIPRASRGVSQQHNLVSPIKNLSGALRQNRHREGTGRIIRNVHVNQDSLSSQHSVVHMEQKVQSLKLEDKRPPRPSHSHFVQNGKSTGLEDKLIRNGMHGYFGERNARTNGLQSLKLEGKRPPWPSHSHFVQKGKSTGLEDKLIGNGMHGYFGERNARTNGLQSLKLEEKRPPRPSHSHFVQKGKSTGSEDKLIGNGMHGYFGERNEKYAKNKDRPDRGVFAPRRSGSHANDESMSSSASRPTHFSLESSEGSSSHMRHVLGAKSGGTKFGIGRNGHFHQDNGSHKHVGRHVLAHGSKDIDGSLVVNEMKSKRGGRPVHGSHEKQVRLQKSAAGS